MKRFALAVLLLAAFSLLPSLESCKKFEVPGAGATGSKKASLAMAPDVTFKGLDGQDVSLASLKGKVVLVNFWATWCEPCQVEIPWMIGFQREYASRGFTILGLSMDEEGKSAIEPFVNTRKFDVDGTKLPLNYPIFIGNDDVAQKFGGLIGLPTTVVISKDGRIVKKYIGLASHEDLDKQIQDLL
jgi:cytochrome c biogenesis protein CcmG/thiol:disulfide interchange protein DsbE